MNKKVLSLIILITLVSVIILGLIGWQTGFVVKDIDSKKSGLMLLNDEKDFDELATTYFSEDNIIEFGGRRSSGGSSSGGSSGGGGGSSSSSSRNSDSDSGDNSDDPQITYTADISVDSYSGNKDDEFIIKVKISTQEEIYAVEFELNYDSEILEVISENDITKGNFLDKDGADTYEIIKINNIEGKITFASTRFNIETGISGQGSLAEIKFKAINIGTTDLILKNVEIADTSLDVSKFQTNIKNTKVNIS